MDAPTPGIVGSEAGDAPTPGPDFGGDEGEAEEAEEDEGEGDIDEDLAAELDLALGDEDEEGDDEEDEEEDESEDEEDDDDDDEAQERKLLNEEIRDLEAAVLKKQTEIASSANPLIKVFVSTLFSRSHSHITFRNGLRMHYGNYQLTLR